MDLVTRKFEAQYILDWELSQSTMQLNNDSTLLAVAAPSIEDYKTLLIYVYSSESGMVVTKRTFKEYYLWRLSFIGLKEEERLFFVGLVVDTENFKAFVMNPLTHSLEKSSNEATGFYLIQYDESHRAFESHDFISDYIINIKNNYLEIQKLSKEENWTNYLQDKDYERYVGTTFCNVKEIREFIQETLKKYKQGLMQNTSRRTKQYDGKPYTWFVIYEYSSYWEYYFIYLKAQVESIEKTKETNKKHLLGIYDTVKDYLLEIKVLENGDLLLILPSGIQIWTVDSENVRLLYYWVDESKLMKEIKEESVKDSIINNLDTFIDKLNLHSKILPPPILPPKDPTPWDDRNYRYNFIDNQIIDYWIKDESILKFYGKDIIFKLLQKDRTEEIMDLFNNCLHHCHEKFNSGDLSNFMFLIDIITSTLVDLESHNKNLRVTEKFLSEINLLVPETYKYAINKNSLSLHLQHCGIYNYLHIVNTSLLDRLTFLIFENGIF
ncbi:hypothetical protein C2G38_2266888 [Gigaspora rosea]|uniref:Uncharacterized protein n=1 Tax=Gigaspora rosea TaxID=44941 RepID=A0A397UHK1_9GLOM|nr:hypothetical protein C2G38_2266888 [Gigaspora rosea]